MKIDAFLDTVRNTPTTLEFTDTMAVVEANYDFTPTAFDNGGLHNTAEQNQGSCKLLGLAKALQLTPEQTLACFGKYYREDVLQHPNGDDHQNIRNFIRSGWNGIHFTGEALVEK